MSVKPGLINSLSNLTLTPALTQALTPESSQECVVCFMTSNDYLTCSNPSCQTPVCYDCLSTYLDISLRENSIPPCPNCRRVYLISDIKHAECKTKYDQCCLADLITHKGDDARRTWEITNKIIAIRNERKIFLEERFPRAISFTAQICMPNKLRRVDKQLTDKIEKQTQESTRVCMNLMCTGSLDANLKCLTCQTSFCKVCEKRLTVDHVCNVDDISSIQMIQQSVKCPNCLLPIFRSDGCNNMTCSNCGTAFLYSTGERGGSGSHNAPTEVRTKIRLSVEYLKYLTDNKLLNNMVVFEQQEPDKPSYEKIQNMLLVYYKNKMTLTSGEQRTLSLLYEKYQQKTLKYQAYMSSLVDLEELCRTGTLTGKFLDALLLNI